jgi:hypothetical protein
MVDNSPCYACNFKPAWSAVTTHRLKKSNSVDLADHAAALSAALTRGENEPAGRLLGLPELPEGDVWCDIAGASALSGVPARDHHQLAKPRRTEAQPDRILYRLYWPSPGSS